MPGFDHQITKFPAFGAHAALPGCRYAMPIEALVIAAFKMSSLIINNSASSRSRSRLPEAHEDYFTARRHVSRAHASRHLRLSTMPAALFLSHCALTRPRV